MRFTTTANNPTENNANHIIGTAIMEARTVNAAAFNTFLNFSMAAGANVGNLTLTRRSGHGTATGRGFTPTQGYAVPIGFESIDAHWVADVSNNVSRDITISWLSAWDNGKNLTQMQLWRTNAPFTIGSPWVLKTTGTVDMSARTHTATAPAGELRNAWTVSDLTNPLPVELLSFDAKLKNEKDVELTWYAKNEINLALYELERSIDNIHFETINTTNAKNQAENSYAYLDINAKALGKDVLYYRLKQINLDATSKITPAKAVYFRKSLVVGIYPNPYRDILNVQITNPEKQEIELSIMDNLGKIYLQNKFSDSYIDFKPSTFLPQLANGTYILRLKTNTQTEFFKIVKQ
ncbi:MAG: T9SS type A sorting domain-containing protein [Thermonemataceae bacterium]|nr:T9SS type A sorting domain-containing protein [Thermonemataceae bacterium]